jgi:hypothetical protein
MRERDHLEDLDVDEWITLKLILKKLVWGPGFDWLRKGTSGGFFSKR